jgi:hypothetical protein
MISAGAISAGTCSSVRKPVGNSSASVRILLHISRPWKLNYSPEDCRSAEKKQPDFLDEAAKSITERIATFLAILFAVIALGGTFPPKFLVHNTQNTLLVIAILLCYLIAMGMGMWVIQPSNYGLYQYNVTRQEKEWKRLIARKKFWVRFAGILFGIGTVALAGLIVSIILPT